jgi:hypothetical protein
MAHLLLAGYEDVPSFYNQLKLKRSLILLFPALHVVQRKIATQIYYQY